MFFGWELVGLSSYLLISFWSEKKSASKAGSKAFILNRIGDFGFLIGLMMILNYFETFNFLSIFEDTLKTRPENLDLIILFLLLGAFGKSAQFPLFSWLPRCNGRTNTCKRINSCCNNGYCWCVYAG